MNTPVLAKVFSPGEFLKDELEVRGWTPVEFAEILGKDVRLINEIMNGKQAVTPEISKIFSVALGTTAELWMNLESQYQLSKITIEEESIIRKTAALLQKKSTHFISQYKTG